MKSFCRMLLCLLVCTTCFAGSPKTKEDFLAAVRSAFEAKDAKRIHELTWEKGMSEEDLKMDEGSWWSMVMNIKKIEGVTLGPLPSDYEVFFIADGKCYETTYPALGMLELATSGDGGSKGSLGMPYAVIDGGYYMLKSKSTDLGWKGPQDKPLSVSITGQHQGKVTIHFKYNASGVDLKGEMKPSVGSISWFKCFRGQYIEEVTVVSNEDDVAVTLELREGEQYPGGLIYKSEPLKGKGQIHYKKGDTGASPK